VFLYTRIHLLLVNWCCHSIESRTLTCPFKQSNLSAWSLLSGLPTHTHLCQWLRLSVFSKLFAFHHHSHTKWLGSCQYQRLSSTVSVRIHTTSSRRSQVRIFAFVPRGACAPDSRRTKTLETVVTRVINGISHWIVLFCERYWLAGVWCLCYMWWCRLFFMNCFEIELVLCDLYLTSFALKKDWLFDAFFMLFNKFCRCDHWVFLFKSFSTPMKWRPKHDTKIKAPQTRFFYANFFLWKNTPQATNLCKKMCRRQEIFDWILMGTLSCWCSM